MASARDCAHLFLSTVPHLMRHLRGSMRQQRGPDGESPTMEQFRLLALLAWEPRTVRELAFKHHVAPSTMSRSVDVLVQRGWVSRESDPADRRQVVLRLTEHGGVAYKQIGQYVEDQLSELLEEVDVADRARLFDGITVLQRLLDQLAERATPDSAACETRRG